MPATTKVPLGASTLIRKWYVDVNTGTTAVPVWTGVFGIGEFKSGQDDSLQDDADFDSDGWKSQTKTAAAWSLELKLARKVRVALATAYDPGQEKLRAASMEAGTANTVEVRWYEMTTAGPRVESFQGFAAVSWSPDGGDMEALDMVSVTLTGQGKRNATTHPSP